MQLPEVANVSDLDKQAEGTQGWVEILTPLKTDQGSKGTDKPEKWLTKQG